MGVAPVDQTGPAREGGAFAPRARRTPSGRRRRPADPVAILEAQAATRVPELVPLRYGRMLASPFAFFRGGAAIMAADLADDADAPGCARSSAATRTSANFGGFATPDRTLVFDINDFDETLPGPWEWDVKRLAASFAVAGRDAASRPRSGARSCGAAVRAYRDGDARVRGHAHARRLVRALDVDEIRRAGRERDARAGSARLLERRRREGAREGQPARVRPS